MNTKLALLSTLFFSGPVLAETILDVSSARRESSFDTGRVAETHFSNEARITAAYSLKEMTDLPISLGLSFSVQEYDDFKGELGLKTEAVHNDLSLNFRAEGDQLWGVLTPFANLRQTLYSKGERRINEMESPTGYDVRGTETFSVKGTEISLGTYFPIYGSVRGLFALEAGSKMLKIEDTDVKEYQINLAGGPDELRDMGKTRDGSVAYISTAVMLGIGTSI